MPRVTVEWFEGRTNEQREELAALITAGVVKVAGVAPENVTVVFRETRPELLFRAGENPGKR